jgi:peroxiredoxin
MIDASARDDLRQAFAHARDLDGSMVERLDAFSRAVRALRPEFAETVDNFVGHLRDAGAGANSPKVGDVLPPFVLPDESGNLVSLTEMLRDGPVVMTLHRGHWCPYCRISINTLARAQARMAALGAQMVAIVPEKATFTRAMKSDADVAFPILSDMDNGYALSLNLAVAVGGAMRALMIELGRDLPRYQGNDAWMLPIPATFVVAGDGRITSRFIDPDYRRRAAVEDLVEALKEQGCDEATLP